MTLDEALEILEEEGYEVKLIEEDFTMGVGAPLGADQGIPHSMQGCAVPMMRLGDPAPYGRIQRLPGPSTSSLARYLERFFPISSVMPKDCSIK